MNPKNNKNQNIKEKPNQNQANQANQTIESVLKITIKDPILFREAFTHKSFVNEANEVNHNERLEFLGDAVLELVATDYLYKKYQQYPEGELTAIRSAVVKGKNLARVAKELQLGQFLLMSNGEERSGGRSKSYILANLMEAIIGALYLDQGYEAAREFIARELLKDVDSIVEKAEHLDAKTLLQEFTQEHFSETPRYKLLDDEGPDHDKNFTMGVVLQGQVVAKGQGSSKQKAEKEAASEALKVLAIPIHRSKPEE